MTSEHLFVIGGAFTVSGTGGEYWIESIIMADSAVAFFTLK